MLKKDRNYGIDLLRIVAMFMVVLLHVLGRGGIIRSTSELSTNYLLAWFLEISAICAVNCYAIISGYVGYGRKVKYSNIINLVFSVIFHISVIMLLTKIFKPDVTLKEFANSLLHIRKDGYWYVKAYFCAFFFFPHINFLVEKYEEKKLYILLGGMFLLFSVIPTFIMADVFSTKNGYSPIWILIMYFVGAVIKKYDVKEYPKNKYLFLYLLMVILTFISKIGIMLVTRKLFGQARLSDIFILYTSPTIVLSAIFLVRYFSKVNLNALTKKVVSVMSPLTFGIYLAHTQYFAWGYLEDRFAHFANKNPLSLVISVFVAASVIYLLCSLLDYVREYIFKVIRIKKISEKTEEKIFALINGEKGV